MEDAFWRQLAQSIVADCWVFVKSILNVVVLDLMSNVAVVATFELVASFVTAIVDVDGIIVEPVVFVNDLGRDRSNKCIKQ